MKGRKRRPRKSAIETRKRILDVAQKMFALHGYEATSLRTIISKARVNVAAINYYFGTKEKLFGEVLQRSVKSLNDERLRLLDECLRSSAASEPRLDEVIRAYVAPFLRLHDDGGPGTATMQFLSRAVNEPNPTARNMMIAHMDPIWVRFSPVLQRLLPDLPQSSYYWRFYFMISALYLTGRGTNWLDVRTNQLCTLSNVDEVVDELSVFLIGGLTVSARAAPTRPVKQPDTRRRTRTLERNIRHERAH